MLGDGLSFTKALYTSAGIPSNPALFPFFISSKTVWISYQSMGLFQMSSSSGFSGFSAGSPVDDVLVADTLLPGSASSALLRSLSSSICSLSSSICSLSSSICFSRAATPTLGSLDPSSTCLIKVTTSLMRSLVSPSSPSPEETSLSLEETSLSSSHVGGRIGIFIQYVASLLWLSRSEASSA